MHCTLYGLNYTRFEFSIKKLIFKKFVLVSSVVFRYDTDMSGRAQLCDCLLKEKGVPKDQVELQSKRVKLHSKRV